MTTPLEILRASVEALDAQARGLLRLLTVTPADFLNLVEAAASGNGEALRFLPSVLNTVRRVRDAPPNDRLLCAACPRPLSGGFAVVIVVPAIDDGSLALGFGVCTTCGTDHASIEKALTRGLSAIWPDLRKLRVHDVAGHA